MDRKAMAATYTVVTMEEMTKFLGRTFGGLKPRTTEVRGEYVTDLFFNDRKSVGVRVWTSIPAHSTSGADVGQDAIRVQFFNFTRGMPMLILLKDGGWTKQGKAPIVKRTQGWRDNLRERVDDWLEVYDQRDEEYDRLAK